MLAGLGCRSVYTALCLPVTSFFFSWFVGAMRREREGRENDERAKRKGGKNPEMQSGKEEGEGCRGRLAYCRFGFSSGCDGSNADSSFWMTVDETALALFLRPELSTTSPSPPSEMRLCTPCSRSAR
ncbi:hypothetical protein M431DRAFT_224271 [Trichoderma harzianum CBS 226.95]|uniref:Uncharacterized protein n=1 Tax=Trichoderma harzianum CBS 226.95 TaxID=983964 RepID=A0A2T4A3I2_TRIHA|nr:hypothetical protein M431DRAFT_224271 [Trichoderma harzianum CBS 226.95]PTB51635.1 hypothetical protein M431DRAFT_224271 [Trichoderma harzianum CBS 226.95]